MGITKRAAISLMLGAGVSGVANADEILVNSNISTSTVWTADNTYNLQQQVYVLPGATLTIEPGTIVASTTNIGGSLAVSAGAQIFVMGNAQNPVIMTSTDDVATWQDGNPRTGSWHTGVNEWGNLTVMGRAYVSENATPGNTAKPNANNVAAMEGLVADFMGDEKVLYGGGNDDDDSGTIKYLSLRYGGRVIGQNNELNGLSLGGIGRGTDIHHIDIMNNVDDGIEVWGGTVNFKYINIWNIGDDSFDLDQGWRGKAQFILIVQGYSRDASQGSGVGDNGMEMDGAEDSDWQPVTTAVIENATIIGQPISGDGLTAWRDNARVQFHRCVFMDGGEAVVRFDGDDGDGANGYGFNGTLSWTDTWNTAYTQTSAINAPDDPGAMYQSQTSGKLAEIRDSVFWRNLSGSAYTVANQVNVFDAGNNNVVIASTNLADAPIQNIVRAAPVVLNGNLTMLRVIGLDPRAKNEATTTAETAAADGFFTHVRFRGAFGPRREDNWIKDWTAADAYGFTVDDTDDFGTLGPQKQRFVGPKF